MNRDDLDWGSDGYAEAETFHDVPEAQDVFRAAPDMLDPTVEPPPKVCRECGAELPFTWWPGREGRIAGRWAFPKPCGRCEFEAKRREAATEIERRQENASIPRKHRRYRWGWTELQEVDEVWSTFALRVKATEQTATPRIGIARADAEAARAVRGWEPAQGSMYLHGPVGSGKSLWCAARVTDLLQPTDDEGEVELSEAEMVERGVPESMAPLYVRHGRNRFRKPGGLLATRVLFIDEEELVQRVTLSWKGDPVPLLAISTVDVLVYDDLGAVLMGSTSPKQQDIARVSIARLVRKRWDEQRPVLFTSNRPLDDFRKHMDDSIVSRLQEMVGSRTHALVGVPREHIERGYSWRHPPPDAPEEPRKPAPDRRRQAAGEDW